MSYTVVILRGGGANCSQAPPKPISSSVLFWEAKDSKLFLNQNFSRTTCTCFESGQYDLDFGLLKSVVLSELRICQKCYSNNSVRIHSAMFFRLKFPLMLITLT